MSETADAKTKLKFKITPRDVRRATRKDPHNCAAALALKRLTHADDVKVGRTRTIIVRGSRSIRYQTPPALSFEAKTLDRGGKFEPGDFALNPVPPSQTVVAMRRYRTRNDKKRKRPFVKRRSTPNVRPHVGRLARG
jgi:hypothetical protein